MFRPLFRPIIGVVPPIVPWCSVNSAKYCNSQRIWKPACSACFSTLGRATEHTGGVMETPLFRPCSNL